MTRKIYVYGVGDHPLSDMRMAVIDFGLVPEAVTAADFVEHLKLNPDALGVIVQDGVPAGVMSACVRGVGAKNILFALVRDCGPTRSGLAPSLRQGADDAQPASLPWNEFGVRVQSLIRRMGEAVEYVNYRKFALPGGTYNADTGMLHGDIAAVSFTPTEDNLMQLLKRRQGMVLSRDTILDQLYGGQNEPDTKTIDSFICKVRSKLRAATGDSSVIQVLWGRGYMLQPESEWASDLVRDRRMTVQLHPITIKVSALAHKGLEKRARELGYSVAQFVQLLFEAAYAARVGQERGNEPADVELDEQVRLVFACAGQGDTVAIAAATGVPEERVKAILAGWRATMSNRSPRGRRPIR